MRLCSLKTAFWAFFPIKIHAVKLLSDALKVFSLNICFSLLMRFYIASRKETPDTCQHTFVLEWFFQLLSALLPNGICFLCPLAPAVPWPCRRFPKFGYFGGRYGLSKFPITDNCERFRFILSAGGSFCPCVRVVKASQPSLCTVLVRAYFILLRSFCFYGSCKCSNILTMSFLPSPIRSEMERST